MTWRADEALSFAFPVAVDDTLGFREVAVARGNVAPAHHGRLVDGPGTARADRSRARRSDRCAPSAFELAACGAPGRNERAGGRGLAMRADGRPYRLDLDVALPSGQEAHPEVLSTLLDAPAGDLAAVVEIEDDFPPALRFAAGSAGAAPPFGAA